MANQVERFMGPITSDLQPEGDGQWVRYSAYGAQRQQVLDEVRAVAEQVLPGFWAAVLQDGLDPVPPEARGGSHVARRRAEEGQEDWEELTPEQAEEIRADAEAQTVEQAEAALERALRDVKAAFSEIASIKREGR